MANGFKTGGRKKGTPNKASAARAAEIAASGMTPLDFLLSVMRDNHLSIELRVEAARSAAPYAHPRFCPVPYQPPTAPCDLSVLTDEELEAYAAILGKLEGQQGTETQSRGTPTK
jgi:hypothetical protein